MHGLPLVVATVFFAFQIYCDFSGYSDIAIGAAQVMGFQLMTNFGRPYLVDVDPRVLAALAHLAVDVVPRLRVHPARRQPRAAARAGCFNLLITFLLSGLWHGANWTFVIWGALHGLYLVVGIATDVGAGAIAAGARRSASAIDTGFVRCRWPPLSPGLRRVGVLPAPLACRCPARCSRDLTDCVDAQPRRNRVVPAGAADRAVTRHRAVRDRACCNRLTTSASSFSTRRVGSLARLLRAGHGDPRSRRVFAVASSSTSSSDDVLR